MKRANQAIFSRVTHACIKHPAISSACVQTCGLRQPMPALGSVLANQRELSHAGTSLRANSNQLTHPNSFFTLGGRVWAWRVKSRKQYPVLKGASAICAHVFRTCFYLKGHSFNDEVCCVPGWVSPGTTAWYDFTGMFHHRAVLEARGPGVVLGLPLLWFPTKTLGIW